jgi:hypothetical protein
MYRASALQRALTILAKYGDGDIGVNWDDALTWSCDSRWQNDVQVRAGIHDYEAFAAADCQALEQLGWRFVHEGGHGGWWQLSL